MEWPELKEKIYYEDGSFRDIFIPGATADDWKLWADFVNNNYKVSFTIYEGEITTDKVDFEKVLAFWNGSLDSCIDANVFIGDIIVKAYFFSDDEIENDIIPKEIL